MRRAFLLLYLFILGTTSGCFPHQAGPRLAHFATTAPAVGEPAPFFSLVDLDGRVVDLADLIGDKPIVLQLGSHTCPVYRYRRFWMNDLYDELGDRVTFLTVYTLEAHPVGSQSPYAEKEWDPLWNRLTGVRMGQPEDEEGRVERAKLSHGRLKLKAPMVVDSLDNAVWQRYGAASSPAFIIDREGRIAAQQVWIEPKKIRQVLLRLLTEAEE